jgi:hypothetical protein
VWAKALKAINKVGKQPTLPGETVLLTSSITGRDTLLFFGIPLLALLFIGYFRLDEVVASKSKGQPQKDVPERRRRVSYILEEEDDAPELPDESRSVQPRGGRY